jgi:myo-inositol-1(or 4)-monophosphatase
VLAEELELTETLLRTAGAVLLELRSSDLEMRAKRSPADLVTAADLAAERALLELLGQRRPDDGVLSEEMGWRAGSSGDIWVLDPLDGTTNYATGLDEFGVIVGLTRGGSPILGGMYLPATDALYLAGRGEGAFRNGAPIAVAAVSRVEDAIFDHSLADDPESYEAQLRTLGALIRAARGVRCVQSLSYLARVAEGTYGGFVYHSLALWDICGPSVILREAGAAVCTPTGNPLDLAPTAEARSRRYPTIAANPALLRDLLAVINAAAPPPH